MQDDPDHWTDVLWETDDDENEVVAESVTEGHDPVVFIGHGGSPHWARIQNYLETDLGLSTVQFESESRVGEHIIDVLTGMMDVADLAVLVLTAEDYTDEGKGRARQNVIHEAGLFQGRLGFDRTVVILQEGVEEFSNIAGLQQIRFAENRVQDSFDELRRFMSKHGLA